MSKTESRFKSKLESLKKFPHSASASNAVEKARAFFRSLELKHIGSSHEHSSSRRRIAVAPTTTMTTTTMSVQSSSISSKLPISSSISSSSSSSIIDDSPNTSTTDSSLNQFQTCPSIATARVIRVLPQNYSNPRDMIVHRVIHPEDDLSDRSTSVYNVPSKNFSSFQTENSASRSIHYANGFSSQERSQSYTISMEKHREVQIKHDSRRLSPVSTFYPTITYSSPIYEPSSPSSNRSSCPNSELSDQNFSSSFYNCRSLISRPIRSPSLMSSSFHEDTHRSEPIIRPLSSSVSSTSMSSWSQSVRRLNSEYASTIDALQKAKQSLEQLYPLPTPPVVSPLPLSSLQPTDTISKYANLVARGIENLSKNANDEAKKLTGVTFCLTTPIKTKSSAISPPSQPLPTSKIPIQQNKKLFPTTTTFCKPKVIRPVELDTFVPTFPRKLPKLEPIIANDEKKEKISTIIHKFNNLNTSISMKNSVNIVESMEKNEKDSFSPKSPRKIVQIEEIPYESPPPPMSSSSSSSSISEDSTSSTSSNSDETPICPPDHDENPVQEETTYTVETFYKTPTLENESVSISAPQHVVIIRENTTEEQFNSAREKILPEEVPQHRFTVNQSQVPPLTTPLLTYLNLPMKQTAQNADEKINKTYHSIESTKLKPIEKYFSEDDEHLRDIIAINPHPYSPPLSSSSSHHLISSSSTTSSSSNSSTSTVLHKSQTLVAKPQPQPPPPPSVSQLPKRLTSISNSRLKVPTSTTTTTTTTTTSKIKAPSITNAKSTKTMNNHNSQSLRKPSTISNNNQSSTMTNSMVNKTIQQQFSTSTIGKKSVNLNGNSNMTESTSSTVDSTLNPLGKSRVRSMVNQFNAAARPSSSTSQIDKPRIPMLNGTRRTMTFDSTTSKTNVTSSSSTRPSLQRALTINHNSPLSSSTTSTTPSVTTTTTTANVSSTYKRKTPLIRSTSNVKEGLLRWCQAQVAGYPNVSVTNLSSSWADGLAFCALTHHFFPDAFDFKSLSSQNRQENFELAFRIAEERGGVPRLLDVSDMIIMGNSPDYKCIFTYLNSFLAKVKDLHPPLH